MGLCSLPLCVCVCVCVFVCVCLKLNFQLLTQPTDFNGNFVLTS